MAKPAPFLIAVLTLAILTVAGVAHAGRVIYSFDSATPITRTMTDTGITLILDKTLMHTRVLTLAETQTIGEADLKPASDEALGHGGLTPLIGRDSEERDLYEISPKGDGRALINALCPGADKGYLAFGRIRQGEDLRVRALGHDPATGRSRLCYTLDYAYHGQWLEPPVELPQPDRSDRFNDAPANRRF
jgi:hypothetical protein